LAWKQRKGISVCLYIKIAFFCWKVLKTGPLSDPDIKLVPTLSGPLLKLATPLTFLVGPLPNLASTKGPSLSVANRIQYGHWRSYKFLFMGGGYQFY